MNAENNVKITPTTNATLNDRVFSKSILHPSELFISFRSCPTTSHSVLLELISVCNCTKKSGNLQFIEFNSSGNRFKQVNFQLRSTKEMFHCQSHKERTPYSTT